MNQQLRTRAPAETTQAAEGLARRCFSVAEIEAMVKAGIIDEHERFELIGGEVVPMAAKGIRHELLKNSLMRYWGKACPDHVHFALETTFRLDEKNFVEPDIVFYKKSDGLAKLQPGTAMLAVEVADTSLSYDLGRKIRIYASFAVKEIWVMNAITLDTHVHTVPGSEGYTKTRVVKPAELLVPEFASELSIALGTLELT